MWGIKKNRKMINRKKNRKMINRKKNRKNRK